MTEPTAQYVGLKVTEEELQKLELIMRAERRSTKSDTIRALILEKADFLLAQNNTIALIQDNKKEEQ